MTQLSTAQRVTFVVAALVLALGFAGVRALEKRGPAAVRSTRFGPLALDEDVLDPPVDEDLAPAVDPAATLSIRGEVVDAAGTPLAAINVSLRSLETGISNQNSIRTDANGRFELPGLPRGRYRVMAWSNNVGGSEAAGSLLARAVVDEVEAGRADLRITLRPGRYARGIVRDARGKTLEGVLVCANTRSGARLDARVTRTDGSFEVLLPPDEEFELEARPPTERAASREALAQPTTAEYARRGGVKAGDSGIVLEFP